MTNEFSIPILPTHDLAATRAFYQRLGFETVYWMPNPDGERGFAVLGRGGLRLHFVACETLDPSSNCAGCYMRVSDADTWHARWRTSGLGEAEVSRLRPVEDTPWGMREFTLIDPSGNTIRVGHSIDGEDSPS